MKKITTLSLCLATLCAAFPPLAKAQGTDNDLKTDFGARVSVSADKKLSKGLHLEADAEARLEDDFSSLGRYHLGTGLSYKVTGFLKVGAGYMFIQNKNTADEWISRHRVYADATLSHKTGPWRFSLKERVQMTHKDVGNKFQNTPNSVMLKSRVKVAYKASPALTPYAFVEARTVLNDPSCSATWSTVSQVYSDYSFTGYSDTYFNRYRGSLGVDWKLSKRNSLEFFLLGDYCRNKNIDTNKAGTKLKSLTYDRDFNTSLGVSYTFSF